VWSIINSTGDVPSPRIDGKCAVVDDKIYLFGGRTDAAASSGYSDELFKFSAADSKWTSLNAAAIGTPPIARCLCV
jgi:N-acetylneuraminic acid mutarotase